MAQTPQQRRANAAYAKAESDKRGKPQSEVKKKQKIDRAPISPMWVYLLIFVVCGGLVVEVFRIIMNYFA